MALSTTPRVLISPPLDLCRANHPTSPPRTRPQNIYRQVVFMGREQFLIFLTPERSLAALDVPSVTTKIVEAEEKRVPRL